MNTYIYVWDHPGDRNVEVGIIINSSDDTALSIIRGLVQSVSNGRLLEVYVRTRKLIHPER